VVYKNDVVHLNKKIKEKENLIFSLKQSLDNLINENLRIPNEVIITDPSRDNVEANNEIIYSKDTLDNLTSLLKEETIKQGKLENQRKVLYQY
jgi:hypothetical protein